MLVHGGVDEDGHTVEHSQLLTVEDNLWEDYTIIDPKVMNKDGFFFSSHGKLISEEQFKKLKPNYRIGPGPISHHNSCFVYQKHKLKMAIPNLFDENEKKYTGQTSELERDSRPDSSKDGIYIFGGKDENGEP